MTVDTISHPHAAIIFDAATGQCRRLVITESGEEDIEFHTTDEERYVKVEWPIMPATAFELGFKAARSD